MESDLISRSALLSRFDYFRTHALKESEYAYNTAYYEVQTAKALDVAPVVHAKWTEVGGTYTCSSCGGQYEKYDHMGYWNDEYKYCPHCGARMDDE